MRVVIISVFPPNPAPEANHALHLSERLAALGTQVHVLCPKGSIAPTHENIVVHAVVEDWSWSDLPKIKQCLKECRPDVVFLVYLPWIYNHQKMPAFLPTICKRLLNGVSCVTQFDNIPAWPFAGPIRRHVLGWLMGRRDIHPVLGTLHRDSDRIIVLSSPHRERLARLYSGIDEKMVVLPPPPLIRYSHDDPVSTRKRVRESIGATDTDFVFLFWGYIYPGKGVETLLHAFRTVCSEISNVRLVLVGGCLDIPLFQSPDYYQKVRKLPEKLAIAERVTWTGHFNWDSEAGSEYLHAGDACVLPYDYGVTLNNSSLAAATTHGLPVIGTELGDGPDEGLESGHHIYLCRPQDPQVLAEAMLQLVENPDFRARLRQGSGDLAEEWYSWEKAAKRVVEVLETAISDSKRLSAGHPRSSALISASSEQIQKESLSLQSPWSDKELPTKSDPLNLVSSSLPEFGGSLDESDGPLVSIIVAVHNVANYLSQCLDSLVNQTLKPIEIIVVNDASTDWCPKIIEDYSSQYQSIKVINCERNLGLASVRNIGMEHAVGTYIGFVDGDDWVDIHMCETMYRRAKAQDADVLIAQAQVFYNDSKTFGPFFDQQLRQILDPRLKTLPFELLDEPRVLLLEPVPWTKFYKRSFLQAHGLHFEDGMNSYEDTCFHFFALLKARRISLIDAPLFYYRQNRSGQISGRRSRRVFEVFEVFERLQATLTAWKVPAEIWALVVKVELHMFDWLLGDRVPSSHKAEFLARASEQLQRIPAIGFEHFRRLANPEELPLLFCMRRNWLGGYQRVAQHHWFLYPVLYLGLHNRRRGLVGRGYRRGVRYVRGKWALGVQTAGHTLLKGAGVERQLQAVTDTIEKQRYLQQRNAPPQSLAVRVCHITDQVLFLSSWADKAALEEAVWRTAHDYYLFQTAVFREGDQVVDVGAHLGVAAIYLAKRFPFITVYALEPEPHNYDCLQRNIALNRVTNVVAINKALSGDGQGRTLYADAERSNWATTDATIASLRLALHTHQVETITLVQLFREHRIQHCRMVKISALGAVRESLEAFSPPGSIDFLCGEVFEEDCSQARLEAISWRLARHHFWRLTTLKGLQVKLHQMPREREGLLAPLSCLASA